jgi:CheY-like chemotaxis protein
MAKKILVLDKRGMALSLVDGLESELGCSVDIIRDGSLVRNYLETNEISLAIVNPYVEQGSIINAYVNFIKQDFREKSIPVFIFSRVSYEKLEEKAGLKLGEDYKAYLRKPAQLDEFIGYVKGLMMY